jgi:hypothetical protein
VILIPRYRATDPELAFVLSAVGGSLIFLQGAWYYSNIASTVAGIALFCGGGIVASAALFRSRVTRRRELGVVILLLSLVSLFGLSGFYLGSLLGIFGGSLCIAARGGPFLNPRSSLFSPPSLGAPCPRCGRSIPSWTSKCPYCAYPD